MTLDDALPLVTHQLDELRTAARESVGRAVPDLCDPHPSVDWGQHALALETVMAAAGLPVPTP